MRRPAHPRPGRRYDRDGNGVIDETELRVLLSDLNEDVSNQQFKHLKSEMDTDASGSIDFDEFVAAMDKLIHAGAWEAYDDAGDGAGEEAGGPLDPGDADQREEAADGEEEEEEEIPVCLRALVDPLLSIAVCFVLGGGGRREALEWPYTVGGGGGTPVPDQSDHSGKKRNLLLEKSGRAMFGTQSFGSQTSPPPF